MMLSTLTSQSALPKRPVTAFRILRFGLVEVDRPAAGPDKPLWFTRDQAESIVGAFRRLGRPLAIDYEHQSIPGFNRRPDGLVPAAGWIGDLELRSDGLWAIHVKWTAQAATLLKAGEYRYFSPVLYWTDQSCTAVGALGPVALTNDPSMRGAEPLVASRNLGGSTTMPTPFLTICKPRPFPPDMCRPPFVSVLSSGDADEHRAPDRRPRIISDARAEWAELAADGNPGSTEEEYVNKALERHRLIPLKEHEIADLGISTTNAATPDTAAATDAALGDVFESSAELRREFGDVGTFAAYVRAHAAGRVMTRGRSMQIFDAHRFNQSPPVDPAAVDAALLGIFKESAALQAEFGGDVEAFGAFTRAQRDGRVQLVSKR